MKNKRGFTLIELVVVLALVGIVLSVVFSPIIFSFKNFDMQNEKANVISDARATMDYLTREIRKGGTVKVVKGSLTEDGSLTIDSKKYKLENGILYKDKEEIIEGIDDVIIEEDGEPITIGIIIGDSKGKHYKLSSDINLR